MKVTVRLVSVDAALPLGPDGALDLPDGTTLAQLLARLALPDEGGYAVLVDDAAVAEGERAGHVLAGGEKVTVLPPIKGG
ncbi:MAG: MoaD/ThiS family protein [Hyphomicrobiales bacterium]|nr:MoaD/ThiS family protein [Hyphomicrobiales bacterium]